MLQIGPYQVLKELARGGMGVVYLAQGPAGEQVAIKLLLAAGLADPEQQRRFQREAQALEALEHPGVLRVQSHGVDRGRPFMVMDLLAGPTLADAVRAEGPLPAARVVNYGRAMAAALAHAHSRGVVHRDLKPANVILRGDDPVLVDFGLVRLSGHDVSRLTQSGTIMGSPAYMSPEQADGVRDVGPTADVYGLGATLYCLLTGRPPFEGTGVMGILKQVLMDAPPPPSQLRPGLDPALERVILRCLEKEPDQRYPSAAALEQAFAKLAAPARRSRRAPQQRASKPSPLKAALPALLTGIPALLLGGWFVLGRGEPEPSPIAQTEQVADTPGQPSPEARRLVDEAQALGEAGHFEEARAKLNKAVARDPGYALAYAKRGVVLIVLRRYAEALEDLDRALELDPRTVDARLNRGSAKLELGLHPEAIADFTRALELDPDDVDALLNRSTSLSALNRDAESIADLDRLLILAPDHAKAYANRGAANARLGRLEGALEDLDQAIRLNPASAESWELRGRVFGALRRFEKAIADHDRALALDPRHAKAFLGRAAAKNALRRHAEAITDFDQALRLGTSNPKVYRGRASALSQLGRFAEAIADYDRALELAPSNALTYLERAEVETRRGRTAAALADYRKGLALGLSPESEEVVRRRIEALEAGSATSPPAADHEQVQRWFEEGLALAKSGQLPEAVAKLDLVLSLKSNLPDAHRLRGQCLLGLSRFEEAIEAYDNAERLGGGDAKSYTNRGMASYALGRHEDAIADCDRALRLEPTRAMPRINRAQALGALGRHAEAIAEFDRALKLRLSPADLDAAQRGRAQAAAKLRE